MHFAMRALLPLLFVLCGALVVADPLPAADQRSLRASLASFASRLAATEAADAARLVRNFTSSAEDVSFVEGSVDAAQAVQQLRFLPAHFVSRLLRVAESEDFAATSFAIEVEVPLCRYQLFVGSARTSGSAIQFGAFSTLVSCSFASRDCGDWALPWRRCDEAQWGPAFRDMPALTALLRREAASRILSHPAMAAQPASLRRSRRSAGSQDSLRTGVSSFLSKFQWLSDLVKRQELTVSTPIRRITSRGFEVFSQSASMQAIAEVDPSQYPSFVEYALNMIDVSPTVRSEVRRGVFDLLPFLGQSEWHDFNILFRSGSGGSTKFVSVLAHNGGSRGFDFVIADFQTSFQLAPDLLVVERKSSSMWGAFGSSETVIHKVPASIRDADLDVLMAFFDLAAFRRFALMLDIPVRGARFRRSAAVGYIAAVQAGVKLYGQIAKTFSTKKTSQIVGKIIGKGFDFFSMQSRAHVISRMNPVFLPRFLGMLDRLYGFPAKYLPQVSAVMEMVQFVGHQDWNKNDFLFDVNSGGHNAWVTVLSNRNEDGTFNFLIANVRQRFRLAPDVLIIKESKSVLGGIYQSEKYKFHRIPRSITEEDLQALTNFFNIITFKRFGLQLNVDTQQLDP
ncbi:hypothetical protein BOX15_Mlig000053g1 [Macrostomum lignano]|uniref:Uncharacterized protein n=1 Tax=Macrostomum lignano TaxID=282301 RepID=A0A267H7R2_9PLAT|nr:hypothetical protein BOX15_Mlig000053g1 [Macrostomum lignano]